MVSPDPKDRCFAVSSVLLSPPKEFPSILEVLSFLLSEVLSLMAGVCLPPSHPAPSTGLSQSQAPALALFGFMVRGVSTRDPDLKLAREWISSLDGPWQSLEQVLSKDQTNLSTSAAVSTRHYSGQLKCGDKRASVNAHNYVTPGTPCLWGVCVYVCVYELLSHV